MPLSASTSTQGHAQDAEAAKKDEQQAVAKQKAAQADAEPAVKKKAETEAAAKQLAEAKAKQKAEAEAAAKEAEAEAEAEAKKKAEVEAAAEQHAEAALAAKKKAETVDVHRATLVTSKSAINAARTPDRGDLFESSDIGSDHEGHGCAPVDSAEGSRCPKCNVFVNPTNIGRHVESCTQCPSCEKSFPKSVLAKHVFTCRRRHAKKCPGVHRGEPVCESATAVSQPQAEAQGLAQAHGAPMLLACTPSWQGRTPAQDSPMPLINGSESLVSRTAFAEQLVADGAVPFKAPTPTVETKFRVLLTGSDDDELALILIPPVGRIGNGHSEDSALSTSDTPQWAFTELHVPKFTLVEDAASLSVNFRSIPTANESV